MKTIFVTAFVAVIGAAPLAASPLTGAGGFGSVTIFGDSLSDPGNASEFLSNLGVDYPAEPYYQDPETGFGQFSDGRVWSAQMTDLFEAEGLGARNYAFANARAVEIVTPPPEPLPQVDLVPDLPRQIVSYAIETATGGYDPVNELAILFFGGNDITAAVSAATGDPAGLRSIARAAAQNVGLAAQFLAAGGTSTVTMVNLPDLSVIPRYNLYGTAAEQDAARFATAVFNRQLAREARQLRRFGVNVVEVDLAAQLDAVIAEPSLIGLTDAVTPCGVPDGENALGLPVYDFSDCEPGRLFFDDIHVSAEGQDFIFDLVHGSIADALLAQTRISAVAVPLPAPVALMAVALGLLAATGRRRRTV